ncbi:MAG TPA: protein-L-isoaspartate(D-aspartate) O-methyltransferase [Thermoplasmata archaeon]|jgi:protein-L-isoaspartate(D-aspartate) O-methyltransferase|nr:protein-L-isoaspartate(D-aspartate) O-methyltransferase [Thermoplasmata archaeon]
MFDQERERLVLQLHREGYLKTNAVQQAFLKVPREAFLPDVQKGYAYVDTPLDIGNGQTISAPHMVAIMCEALDIKKGQKILEIGTGSGYHAAIVAQLVGTTGTVYTIERFESLATTAKHNLEEIKCPNVIVEIGDGSCGLPAHQPYDRIYVTCAAPDIPQPLIDQLQDPGKLLIPVGDMFCELTILQKEKQKQTIHHLGGCVFVPLVGRYGH